MWQRGNKAGEAEEARPSSLTRLGRRGKQPPLTLSRASLPPYHPPTARVFASEAFPRPAAPREHTPSPFTSLAPSHIGTYHHVSFLHNNAIAPQGKGSGSSALLWLSPQHLKKGWVLGWSHLPAIPSSAGQIWGNRAGLSQTEQKPILEGKACNLEYSSQAPTPAPPFHAL